MLLAIDPKDGVAIYEQICRQVKFAIAAQAFLPGETVPSVRELSRTLAINPNTVARAYRDLQTEGVLVPIRGTGLAVADDADKLCRSERAKLIRQRIRQAFNEARHSQLDADQLKKLVEEELGRITTEAGKK